MLAKGFVERAWWYFEASGSTLASEFGLRLFSSRLYVGVWEGYSVPCAMCHAGKRKRGRQPRDDTAAVHVQPRPQEAAAIGLS